MDEAAGIRSVQVALDRGINFIDVAPYYGQTKAETVLGRALKGIERDRYILATKVGRYGVDQFDFSAARVKASVDGSLSRLGVNCVDLIQCHDIEFADLKQIVNETLPALREVCEQGKARFVGITGLPLKIFREVMHHAEIDTALSYCRYTLLDISLREMIPYFQAENVGIINAAPLAMGLLTERGAPDWHPASPEQRQACAAAACYCRERGVDISQLALQFAVANQIIATTVTGTADPDEVERNAACIEEPLDMELVAEVQAILQPVHNRTWPSGRPENND